MLRLELSVDTNSYDEQDEDVQRRWAASECDTAWSLWQLKQETLQDWETAGQTGIWNVEGDTFCGTRYTCEVNYRDDLLLRVLVGKIKVTCGERFLLLRINDALATFTDDGLLEMNPDWLAEMKA
jgi:hypothetical protein